MQEPLEFSKFVAVSYAVGLLGNKVSTLVPDNEWLIFGHSDVCLSSSFTIRSLQMQLTFMDRKGSNDKLTTVKIVPE